MSAEEDIRRTMGRYIQGHDTHDVEAIVSVFAEDGAFINPGGEFRNHAGIRQFFGNPTRQVPGRKGKLMCANHIIQVDGDTASALVDVVGFRKDGDDPWAVYLVAQYADKFVKRDGQWLYLEKLVVQ